MVIEMREKLVELIRQIVIPFWAGEIADHLIANGVTIPVRCKDCKIGKVFSESKRLVDCPHYDDKMVDFEHFCGFGERRDTA